MNTKLIVLTAIFVCLCTAILAQTDSGLLFLRPAIQKAFVKCFEEVPRESRVALVPMTDADRTIRGLVTGEVEVLLVEYKYKLVERTLLDQIRDEIEFQWGWEIDPETAVAVNSFTGAQYLVFMQVTGTGTARQLQMKVLDISKAEVIGRASERF